MTAEKERLFYLDRQAFIRKYIDQKVDDRMSEQPPEVAEVRDDTVDVRASNLKDFSRLTIPDGGFRFDGGHFRLLSGPVVYVFLLGDEVLYVGMSRNGMSRCANTNHLQAKRAHAECSDVMIWPTRSIADAVELEQLMIGSLSPRYNKRLHGSTAGRRIGFARWRKRESEMYRGLPA